MMGPDNKLNQFTANSTGETSPSGKAMLFREGAKNLLKADGIRLSLAFSLIITLASFFAGFMLAEGIYEIAAILLPDEALLKNDLFITAVDGIAFLTGMLTALPAVSGVMFTSSGIVRYGRADLLDMFAAFSSPAHYFKFTGYAMLASLPVMISSLFIFAAACVCYSDVPAAAMAASVTAAVSISFLMFLFRNSFVIPAAVFFSSVRDNNGELKVKAGKIYKKTDKSIRKAGFVLAASSSLRFLLALLTLGILYFIHYGPAFSLERAYAAAAVLKNNTERI